MWMSSRFAYHSTSACMSFSPYPSFYMFCCFFFHLSPHFAKLLLPKKSHMEIKCLNKRAARRCVYVNYVLHQKFRPLFFVDILIQTHAHIHTQVQNVDTSSLIFIDLCILRSYERVPFSSWTKQNRFACRIFFPHQTDSFQKKAVGYQKVLQQTFSISLNLGCPTVLICFSFQLEFTKAWSKTNCQFWLCYQLSIHSFDPRTNWTRWRLDKVWANGEIVGTDIVTNKHTTHSRWSA